MDEGTFPWRGRRVLVTGGTGFLGGAVIADLLARGAEIVGLVRDREAGDLLARHALAGRVSVVYGRAEDLFRVHSALAVYEAGAVFHLAANETIGEGGGIAAVLDAVRRYDPRIPVVTDRPCDAAPLRFSTVLLGAARFGKLFGRDDPEMGDLIPPAVSTITAGRRSQIAIEQPGLDFVHVRDAARACVMLAEALSARMSPDARHVTFRSGWVLSAHEMAAAVRDVLDGREPRYRPSAPPPNPLGWAPVLKFADAVADTIQWFRTPAQTRFSGTGPSDPPRRAAA